MDLALFSASTCQKSCLDSKESKVEDYGNLSLRCYMKMHIN